MKKHITTAFLLFIWSIFFVWISTFFDGITISAYDELQTKFPIYIGFPIPYVELISPHIDPPLPYTYDMRCCTSAVHYHLFWQGTGIVFFVSYILVELGRYMFLRYKN